MVQEPRRRWGWKRWTIVGVAAALVLFVGGPYVYIHFHPGPDARAARARLADARLGSRGLRFLHRLR